MIVGFRVLGVPRPQGSMRAVKAGNGKAVAIPGGGNAFAAWRNAVAEAAAAEASEHGPVTGAVGLAVVFRFPMPASRSAAARRRGTVPKTTAPDLDKLVRAVADALVAGGLITDDARITNITATKVEVWQDWTGAAIHLIGDR